LAIFLNPYYKSKNSGLSSYFKLKQKQDFPVSTFVFFTGLLNASFSLLIFIYLIFILIPTALLICIENTFWKDGNFLESFKESFTLYIDSGMRMKAEVEANILGNVDGKSEHQATKDFEERFCKLIINHYLRKIHCFFKHSTLLTASFTLYSPLQVW
jgi:hypothetical protein